MINQRPNAGGPFLMLVGAPASGKSWWAKRHFPPDAIVSSDALRALVSGDPGNMDATPDAMRVLHAIVEGRLRFQLPTVVDATNADPKHRGDLLGMGYGYGCRPIAVIFDTPLQVCLRRNRRRRGSRRVPEQFIRETHAKVRAEFPVETTWIPPGFAAGAWVVHNGGMRVGGFIPREYRAGRWLDAARPENYDPMISQFRPAATNLRHAEGMVTGA